MALAQGGGAQLLSVSGKVLVDQGNGYQPAESFVDLAAGSRVFVGAEGQAKLAYVNGCVVELSAGAVVTVSKTAPCASGAVAANGDSIIAPMADVVYSPEPTVSYLPLLLLGAVVAGGVTYAIVESGSNSGSGAAGSGS